MKGYWVWGLLAVAFSAMANDCDTFVFVERDERNAQDYRLRALEFNAGARSRDLTVDRDRQPQPLVRSPDCRWIAGFGTKLYDVQGKVAPTELGTMPKDISFSSDSRFLTFTVAQGTTVLELATQSKKSAGSPLSYPFFSADGNQVFGSHQDQLLRFEFATGTRSVVNNALKWGHQPTVSAKGFLFYAEDPNTWQGNPWFYEYATLKATDLKSAIGESAIYGITPDGSTILFSPENSAPAWTAPFGTIEAIATDGTHRRTVHNLATDQGFQPVSFSPGSSHWLIYFYPQATPTAPVPPSPPSGLFSLSLAGKAVRLSSSHYYPTYFSKDGKRVIYWDDEDPANDKHLSRLWASELDGTGALKLLEITEDLTASIRTEDMHSLRRTQIYLRDRNALYYFRYNSDGNYALNQTDVLTGATTVVFDPFWGTAPTAVRIAPDGKTLLFFLEVPKHIPDDTSRPTPTTYRLVGFDSVTGKATGYGSCLDCLDTPFPP